MEQLLAPKPLADGPNLPEEWKIFKRDFELFLTATSKDTAEGKVKTAYLLRTIGRRGNQIYDSFNWTDNNDKTDYDKVVTQFDDYCKPRINLVAKTHSLLTCKQGNRTIDEFLTELHTIAGLCDLDDMYNRLILQALILGIESDKIRKKLFDLTDFDKAIELCRREEASAIDYKTMTKDNTYGLEQVNLVKHRPPTHQYHSDDTRNTDKHRGQLSHTRSQPNVRRSVGASRCGNCGGNHPPRSCPAYGKQCNHCKKFNHFAAYCRSRMHYYDYRNSTETANQVTWNYSSDSDSQNVSTISTTVRDRKLLATLTAKQADTSYNIEFQLDTGASCNTLNTVDYCKLGRPKLTPTDTVLTLYDQSKCAPLG